MKRRKPWCEYLRIFSALYLTLGTLNIPFAWLDLLCFFLPLAVSLLQGSRVYCNKYCGCGQLFELPGQWFGLSRKKTPPEFLRSKWFRYGFLTFFMTTFGLTLHSTWPVFSDASLQQAVTLLWAFRLPWSQMNTSYVPPAMAQFAFGFYGVMLTSTILGLLTMLLFKPRSWCVYCPVGTITQGIYQVGRRKDVLSGRESKETGEAAEGTHR